MFLFILTLLLSSYHLLSRCMDRSAARVYMVVKPPARWGLTTIYTHHQWLRDADENIPRFSA